MLKDIEIKNKRLGVAFADALDVALAKAMNSTDNDPMKREYKELSGEEINKFFSL